MTHSEEGRPSTRVRDAARFAKGYFGGGSAFRGWGLARSLLVLLFGVPALFHLQFGEVDAFALGVTGALMVLVLLVSIGLWIQKKPELATAVPQRIGSGVWLDRIGALWVLMCFLGPALGWVASDTPTLRQDNWRLWLWLRVALAGGLPLVTALPLVRYLDANSWKVGLPLLVGLTALAALSSLSAVRDLRGGPVRDEEGHFVLRHIGRPLATGGQSSTSWP